AGGLLLVFWLRAVDARLARTIVVGSSREGHSRDEKRRRAERGNEMSQKVRADLCHEDLLTVRLPHRLGNLAPGRTEVHPPGVGYFTHTVLRGQSPAIIGAQGSSGPPCCFGGTAHPGE